MKTEIIIGLLGAAAIAFIGYTEGFDACQRKHDKALSEAQAKAKAEAEKREAENAKTVSDLLGKMQALEARNRSLSSTASRLSERLRSAGLSPGADPGDACGVRLSECQRLLGEGVELLAEGSGLAERISARKDAIVKLK